MAEQRKSGFAVLEDAGRRIDQEVKRLVDYMNNRVVPAAREDTEAILRRASDTLKGLADRLASQATAAKRATESAASQAAGAARATGGAARAQARTHRKRPPKKK